MKKTLLIVLTAILLLSFTSVRAESNKKIYFTNMNGVELTEQQYNNLLEGFSPDTINTMSAEMINPLKNDTNIQKNTTTKYVKVITEYKNGEAINSIQEEVSKLEYDASPEIDSIIVATKGAILYSGRKNKIYSKILCAMPAIFILIETTILFISVFTKQMKLFSAITDLISLILYIIFLMRCVFNKNIKKEDI